MNKFIYTLLIVVFTMLSYSVEAQNFDYQADLDSVEQNGFYKIALSPEITSKLVYRFTDILLFQDDNEIPYIFYEEPKLREHQLFVEYDIIEVEHIKAYGYTRIIIHNADKTEINNIVLRIKNADVQKRLKLNASNDKTNWYVLKDNYSYNSVSSTNSLSEIRVLNFPLSNYEYYELLIDDYYDKPIQVLKAGYYNYVKEQGSYTQVDVAEYSISDSLKATWIKIPTKNNYIDRIVFEIDSPKYYLRNAEIYVYRVNEYKNKETLYKESERRVQLISNSSNTFELGSLQADSVFIRIDNNDDRSLKIKSINLYQRNKFLIAELNYKKAYHLKYSDDEAGESVYDLQYFKDSIPANLWTIRTAAPIIIFEKEVVVEDEKSGLENYVLWISIIAVALVLVFLSYKMIKDQKG